MLAVSVDDCTGWVFRLNERASRETASAVGLGPRAQWEAESPSWSCRSLTRRGREWVG